MLIHNVEWYKNNDHSKWYIVFIILLTILIFPKQAHAAVPSIGEAPFTVLAAASSSAVLNPTANNGTTNSNGTEWYYSTSQSMGFAPEGATISQSSADTFGLFSPDADPPTNPYRMSWHLSGGYLSAGWRAGANYNLSTGWNRYIYTADSLPDYFPYGPQTNVLPSALTGWTLCYSGSYSESGLLSQVFSTCTGNFLLLAGGVANQENKLEVKKNEVAVLDIPGGVQTTSTYVGDVVSTTLFQPDGTTPYPWSSYRIYVSSCLTNKCDPGNPLSDPGNWDSGTLVTENYTIPENADGKYLAILTADDETGAGVLADWIRLSVTHIPTSVNISSCDELQLIGNDDTHFLSDYYTLTQNIDCSETESWDSDAGFMPIGDTINQFTGTFDGGDHIISNIHINRPNTDYIGIFSAIAELASVSNLGISNATIIGQNYVGALAGGLSGTVTNVYGGGTVTGNQYIGGLVGTHTTTLGGGSSSPLAFTWNGNNYEYVGDVGRSMPRNNVGNDNLPIDGERLQVKDGKYSINISQEYNEIVFYDELSLKTIDHAPGYNIATSLEKSKPNQIYTTADNPTHPLLSCTDMYDNDCLSSLETYDNSWSYQNISNDNYWTMNFGDLANKSRILLIVQGAESYGIPAKQNLRFVQVKNAQGNWVNVYSKSQLSALGGTPRREVVDLTGKFLTNNFDVRVAFAKSRINYFAIDTSQQQDYSINTYHPSLVDLHFFGYTEINKEFFWDHNYAKVSPTPADLFAAQTGNFTKYGDVTPLLQSTNDQFVIMHHGDQMAVEFPYSAPAEGMERDFILYNWVTYKHADIGAVGKTVEPLPFFGMKKYPYELPEAYPLTTENQQYINNWNTRIITAPAGGGGSTIINSYSTSSVTGNNYVGGLVGYNEKLITGSYATGDISANNDGGGLVGRNAGLGIIEKSYATGNVSGNWYRLGGLVGGSDSSEGIIRNSYATGNVSGTENSQNVGGIAGFNYGKIENSYSAGDVSGNLFVGGFIGNDGTCGGCGVLNSFAVGNVSILGTPNDPSYVGGFVGYGDIYDFTASNNFYYNNMPLGRGDGVEGGGTLAQNSAYFKGTTENSPVNIWDFEGIWIMTPGYYPTSFSIAADNPVVSTNDVYVDKNWTSDSFGADLSWGISAFNDIASAIDAVATSGTVHILAGDYENLTTLTINKAVTLMGPGKSSQTPATLVTNCGLPIVINTSNVSIIGLRIWETNDGSVNGVSCTSRPLIRVNPNNTNTTIDNNDFKGGQPAIGMRSANTFSTITNNTITNALLAGISLGGAVSSTISDNEIYNNGNDGIDIGCGFSCDYTGTTITSNDIYGNGHYGIYYTANDQYGSIVISSNTIYTNPSNIYINGNAYNVHFYGNKIYNSTTPDSGLDTVNTQTGLDAVNNWWGNASGPTELSGNPSGTGDTITIVNSQFIFYRPFCTNEDCAATSSGAVAATNINTLINYGSITVPVGTDMAETLEANVNEDTVIHIPVDVSTSTVTLFSGTSITRSDDATWDVSDLSATSTSVSALTGFGTGEVAEGALQWGIPSIGLHFDPAINIHLWVGTSLNGQTLTVKRSLSQTDGWVTDGIVAPGTCVVANGFCDFSTTKASYFVATKTTSSNPPSGGGGSAMIIVNPRALSQFTKLDFTVSKGADSISSNIVNIEMNADPKYVTGYAISLDKNFINANINRYTPTTTLVIPAKEGTQTVYLKYYSTTGNASETISRSIDFSNPSSTIIETKYVFKKNLSIGMTNNDVNELQKFLNRSGYIISKSGAGSPGKETAKFGSATRSALIKFQKYNKITPAVGYFGPSTRKLVNSKKS